MLLNKKQIDNLMLIKQLTELGLSDKDIYAVIEKENENANGRKPKERNS